MQYRFIITQSSQPEQPIPLIIPSTPRPASPCGCGCNEVLSIISDNTTHYASWRCVECDRFREWIPKPTNLTATQAENELIEIRHLLPVGVEAPTNSPHR
jgi:hypothetical protein